MSDTKAGTQAGSKADTKADTKAGSDTDVVLNVKGVSKRFGGLQALSDVGINIKRGDRKSTRLNSSHVVTSRMPSSA